MKAKLLCQCGAIGALALLAAVALVSGALSCDKAATTDLTSSLNPMPEQTASAVLASACPAPPPGTAPVDPPTGGLAIDGDLRANTPTSGIGDWLPGAAGTGGSVLTASGCAPLNSLSTFHLIDVANSSSDNNFKGGLKANWNPNVWTWLQNPVNAKQDLKHALIQIGRNPANGHVWIEVATTRESNNGDSYIDFEFLQKSLSLTTNPGGVSGGFTSAGLQGGRTLNDFILTVNFTGGGTTAGLCVLRWKASGSGYDYFDDTANLPAGAFYGAANNASVSVPNCPSGNADTYAVNSFAEVAVDLTALVGDFDPCLTIGVKSILVKTKESQSPTATIVDFVAPIPVNLVIGPSANAGDDQPKCSEGSSTTFNLTGTATAGTHPIASMAWSIVSGPVTIDPPLSCLNCLTLPLTAHVSGAPATATLRLTVVDTFNCTKTDDVVLTVNTCTGACCLPCPTPHSDSYLNTCVVETEAECAARVPSGHFQGLGSTCPGATCGTCPSDCSLTCPDSQNYSCVCAASGKSVIWTSPSVTNGTFDGCFIESTPGSAVFDALISSPHTFYTTTQIECRGHSISGGLGCSCRWTVTISQDTSPPTFTCPTGGDLGCNLGTAGNPGLPTCASVKAQVTNLQDTCDSNPTINCTDGGVQSSGCQRSETFTLTATDACGNSSTPPCQVTYTWKVVTAPAFDICGQTVDLGCNPESLPTCANYADFGDTSALGAVTAANECGPVTPDCSVEDIDDPDGCHHTRTLTFTANSGCGLTNTCTRTYNWTRVTAPAFDDCGQTVDLGCNPTSLPSCDTYASFPVSAPLGPVTASNECGSVAVTCCKNPGADESCDNSDHAGECTQMRTLRFTATSCGLTGACTRTFVWRQN